MLYLFLALVNLGLYLFGEAGAGGALSCLYSARPGALLARKERYLVRKDNIGG